jgi:hypothetical protein
MSPAIIIKEINSKMEERRQECQGSWFRGNGICIAVRLLEAGTTLIEAIMKFWGEESI